MNNVKHIPYKKKNSIIYIRSDKNINETLVQVSLTNKFIELNNLHLKTMYIDNEVSNMDMDRSQLLAAKNYLQNNSDTVLIVTSLDRLFGKDQDLEEFVRFLEAYGCHLVSLEERIDTLNNGYGFSFKKPFS